jgi:hypothetical protein
MPPRHSLWSIYSDLTDMELDYIIDGISKDFPELLDEKIPKEERKLKKIILNKSDNIDHERVFYLINQAILEKLCRVLQYFALLQILAMEKNNYRDFYMGRERTLVSFLRNFCNINNLIDVTSSDEISLRIRLIQLEKDLGDLTGDEIIKYFKDYPVKILGKDFSYFSDLNPKLIDLLDVDYQMYSDSDNFFVARFILGKREIKDIDGYKVHLINREYVRTPNYTLSEVASLYDEGMKIRMEAIEVVFYNKWYKFYSQPKFETLIAQKHPNSALREGFKLFALKKSNAYNQKDVKKLSNEIISDIKEGIVFHELGHLIANSDFPKDESNFQKLYVKGDNLIHGLMELMADLAPERGNKKGSFERFIETSKKDYSRAERKFFFYLSDCWFVDEEEEFFAHLSNVLVGMAISFIDSNGRVDFKRLESEIEHIYNFLLVTLRKILKKLMSVIKSSYYNIDNKKVNFSELENEIYNEYISSNNEISLEEYRDTYSYWKKALQKLENYKKTGWKSYNDIFKDETEKFELDLLNFITNNRAGDFNFSLRKYIFARADEIGLIKISNHDINFINIIENLHAKTA